MTTSVNVIVTTLNWLAFTKWCIRSIVENTHIPYELIVVDDGSTDGTVEWLKGAVPQATVIENDSGKKHGWWGGNNIGLGASEADYYAFVDRDFVVTRNWLGKLISMLEQRPEVGIAAPVQNEGNGEQGIPQRGGPDPNNPVQRFLGVNYGVSIPHEMTYEEIQCFGGFIEETYAKKCIYNAPVWMQAVVVPHETIAKVGSFDEEFFWADGDIDYVYRCIKAGLLPAVRLDTYAHELWTVHDGVRWISVYERFAPKGKAYYDPYSGSRERWVQKYGTHVDKPEGRDWNSFLPHKDTMTLE